MWKAKNKNKYKFIHILKLINSIDFYLAHYFNSLQHTNENRDGAKKKFYFLFFILAHNATIPKLEIEWIIILRLFQHQFDNFCVGIILIRGIK